MFARKIVVCWPETSGAIGPEARNREETLLKNTKEFIVMDMFGDERSAKAAVRKAYSLGVCAQWVLIVLTVLGCVLCVMPNAPINAGCKVIFVSLSLVFALGGCAGALLLERRNVNRLVGCVKAEDGEAIKGVLRAAVRRELVRLAGKIQELQQGDVLGGCPAAAWVRAKELKPLFDAAKELELLDEDLEEAGYGAIFPSKPQPKG